MRPEAPIRKLEARAYRIPTDAPEADGTYAWDATTLVTVEVEGGGARGIGYTYGSPAIVPLVRGLLAGKVIGVEALAVEAAWNAMVAAVRNVGRPGIAATAISAIDAALWDLKAKLLGVPLVSLLGQVREAAPAYASGGFTTYDVPALVGQLAGWVENGFTAVKMKVGKHPAEDQARVAAVRRAIGAHAELMIDGNGAYARAQAIELAGAFAASGVRWFEEPVSSDDTDGLRAIRERAPAGMRIVAGAYGWDWLAVRRLLETGAIDVLAADATRCLGITGFLAAVRLCEAFFTPLSTHTAPSLHAHLACAATPLVSLEYFHDHARIEQLLFDGFVVPSGGTLRPDRSRPGLGIALRRADAERFAL